MRKLSNEEFDLNLSKIMPDYKRIDNYVNTKTKIKFLHKKCNRIFESMPYNIMQGYGCPYCYKKEKKSHEEFKKEFYELVGNEYSLLSKYINNKSKITIKHNTCGYIYDTKANNFLSLGRRCPKCANVIKKSEIDVQKVLDEIEPNEYKVIGTYKNNHTNISIEHKQCGTIFECTFKNITKNRFSCPNCNMTSGELMISNILKNMNIDFIYQYKNDLCTDNRILPYDFYFKINNNEYIIEYDGRQHYLPIFGYNDEERNENLKITKKHDIIKNQFCKNNNIKLLRIKYDKKRNDIIKLIENFIK